jgi:poly(A) polymerase
MTLPGSPHNESPEDLAKGATRIVRVLTDAGHPAFWAGGAVRDMLLGARGKDIDVATSARPERVADLFPRSVLVGKSFGVVRVTCEGSWYEVATFRKDGVYLDGRHPEAVSYSDHPETDARRRDFTVNALFYDPIEDRILDFVGGQKDLERRAIRAVGNPVERFREDRLRLLRAVRFAAQIDFAIEEITWEALRAAAPSILEISAERIRDEILRILVQPRASKAFRLLSESGLLKEILPEVENLRGVEQPAEFHPEGDVFDHTMLMLDALEDPTPELAMAALFHDIGKPATFERADRIRFNNHDKLGARMFDGIAERLRLSNQQAECVRELVDRHMCFRNIPKMRPSKRKRLMRSDFFPDLLELHRLDCLASHQDRDLYDYCREQMETVPEEELRPPKLIDGHDLIELGLQAGPLFSQILSEIEDLQLEGQLDSRDAAISFVKKKHLACEGNQ